MKYRTASELILVAAAVSLGGCATVDHQHGACTPEITSASAAETTPSQSQPAAETRTAGTWIAIPTGQKSTSTLLLEKIAPKEVVVGQPFDYDLKVTNLTDLSLDRVVVTDSLPNDFQPSFSNPKQEEGPNGVTMWTLGTLAPREAKTIHLTGTASNIGAISSCASATYTTALCNTINVVQPALRLEKAAPAQAMLCDPFIEKLTVTNAGTGTARDVHIIDPLPLGLKTIDGNNTIELAVPALAAGESKEFTINLKADKLGLYSSSALATADAGLKASSSEAATRVTQPVLTLAVKGPEHAHPGMSVTYAIIVTNTGDAVARDTLVENPIPMGATYGGSSENGRATTSAVTWTLGEIEPKASRTLHATFNFPNLGDVKDAATANAYCAAPVTNSVSTTIAGVPALLLDGFDDPDPVLVGDSTVYTLIVTNQGSIPLTNVKLVCTMEDKNNMSYLSSQGATTASTKGRTITFAPITKLEPKEKATFKINIKATDEGQVQFKAEVTSDEITRPLSKIETTHFYR